VVDVVEEIYRVEVIGGGYVRIGFTVRGSWFL